MLLLLLKILCCLALTTSIYAEVEVDVSRPTYHLTAPVGHWMNDPNGPFYDESSGTYHLFYQYNPFGYNWGNMSWAHVVSRDLLAWTELPVALWPDEIYDVNGVFSGSVFVEEGVPTIYYTCVNAENEQLQCKANAADTSHSSSNAKNDKEENLYINWIKDDHNPIISQPPVGGNSEFRDPFLFVDTTEQEKVMAIVAAQQYEYGAVVTYERIGEEWTYMGNLWSTLESPNTDAAAEKMIECPDFFPSTGTVYSSNGNGDQGEEELYVLKYSLMSTRRDYYELGEFQNEVFKPNGHVGIVDNGPYFSYYASKSFWDSGGNRGRRILWGWSPEADNNAGDRDWQGVMALPRIVMYDDNWKMLRFSPLPALDALRREMLYEGVKAITFPSSTDANDANDDRVDLMPLAEPGIFSIQADVSVSFDVTTAMTSSSAPLSTEGNTKIEMGVSISGCGNSSYTVIGFHVNPSSGQVYTLVDTTRSGGSTPSSKQLTELPLSSISLQNRENLYTDLSLRVLIDHSMVEVFFLEGISVSTVRVYANKECQEIAIYRNSKSDKGVPTIKAKVRVDAMALKG